jgi:hypothetical protein
MKKSRILHLKTLQELDACADQVRLFRKCFGESIRVTKALCVKVAQDFNFDWAAQNLLTPAAWAEHQRVAARAFARGYLS